MQEAPRKPWHCSSVMLLGHCLPVLAPRLPLVSWLHRGSPGATISTSNYIRIYFLISFFFFVVFGVFLFYFVWGFWGGLAFCRVGCCCWAGARCPPVTAAPQKLCLVRLCLFSLWGLWEGNQKYQASCALRDNLHGISSSASEMCK